jgi:type IV pilus assembly protein PilB
MLSDDPNDILLRAGKITEAQLAAAQAVCRATGKPLAEVLAELNYVSSEEMAQLLAEHLKLPFFELGEGFRLESEEVHLIPEAVARRYCMIPVKKDKFATVTLVMQNPLDLEAVDAARSLTRLEVHKAVSTGDRIQSVIDKFYREEAHIERNLQDIVDLEAGDVGKGLDPGLNQADQLRVLVNDVPVVRFVKLLLLQAVRDRASDIHFEPGEKDETVRIRVDGNLRIVTPPPPSLYQGVVARIKILAGMDIAERRLPLDGRFRYCVHDRVIDVRVSSLPEVFGEKMVLRILDRAATVGSLEDVGFEEETLIRFKRILKLPHGIVLLTGPTGSGKTTTLYGALRFMKSPEKNIQTVEDPVEYLVSGVNQMLIRPKIGLDFASALRAILRQDPDIIMIGEIRDAETAQIAMRASLTGHLVLSTLHTNDATSAFCRLRDIGVESYLIASTMKLVIAQRLVRVICPKCSRDVAPSPEAVAIARAFFPDADSWRFRNGTGCKECAHTGYFGRQAILEFLEVTDSIRELIAGGGNEHAFRQKAIDMGMETLLANGLRKVRAGLTTVEEVLSVCPVPDGMDCRGV